jgi:hypothetical protein
MELDKFYIIRSDSQDPNDWSVSLVLKNHIDRLVDRVRSMPDAPTDPKLIAALVASILWKELPQAAPTKEQKLKLTPLQNLIRSHWYVFIQWAIYQEVARYDKILPTSRPIDLTRINLFLHAGAIAIEAPESFLAKYRTVNINSNIDWYRDLKKFTQGKVKGKIRDVIQKCGYGTFGSKEPAILTAIKETATNDDNTSESTEQILDDNHTPRLVEQALIDYGYRLIEGEWQGVDARRLIVLYRAFREVYDGNTLGIHGQKLSINLWGDKEYQLVTDRYQLLTANLPPFQSHKLCSNTTKKNIEFLGSCVRMSRDPFTFSTNIPIDNGEDVNFEIGDFLEAPSSQSSDEKSEMKNLISEYLKSIDNLNAGILIFKYLLIDPSREISPKVKKINPGRKIYPSDRVVGLAVNKDQATVWRQSKDLITKLLNLLFKETGEAKNIDTLRIVLKEISEYYVELLEGYLANANEQLPESERQSYKGAYIDRPRPLDSIERDRIHQFLIERVGEQILDRVKHKKMSEFEPNGQALKAIDDWIESQLSQRN